MDPEYLTYADIAHTSEFKLTLYTEIKFRNAEEIQMEKYSKILILSLFGFTGTVAIADESIPIEATAAAEAQQVA
ncbi:hypothetical protein [Acinetobacter lwoffii]|uniref:Uncharacterized protein n=1 Tax=Acinetobacter lwoffii TaxID=28090 RepID=A0A6N1MX60_ACILW|nr:hypothetical protein [Acinetobacter lwoffii]QKU23101.1 hypothetical protein FOB19_17070 [Acinetobacter lwoffii]